MPMAKTARYVTTMAESERLNKALTTMPTDNAANAIIARNSIIMKISETGMPPVTFASIMMGKLPTINRRRNAKCSISLPKIILGTPIPVINSKSNVCLSRSPAMLHALSAGATRTIKKN